ncbi:MAG TPA: cytochrome c [Pyrinomonadaceae bacterium]|nr:cytochrome c [Pyrinomonadaceae bacterium]
MGRTVKLAVIAVLLVVGICASGTFIGRQGRVAEASAAVAAATQKKLSRKAEQLAAAKVLYVANCARCHGADGESDTPMGALYGAPNLTDAEWWKKEHASDKRLAASIRDGKGGMPAFGKKLSKEEIAALVRLVKTFKGK